MQPKYDAIYRALVTANYDPTGTGKIRVQCPQVAGLAEIRAAEPINPKDPVPFTGSTVWLIFSGGDITKPAYFSNTATTYLIKDWTTATLQSGFSPNGNNNGVPKFQVVSEYGSIKVYWQGGLNVTYPSGSIANGGIWCTSLSSEAPSFLRSTSAACSIISSTSESVKVDFLTDGTSMIVGTNGSTIQPPWISLNNLSYYL